MKVTNDLLSTADAGDCLALILLDLSAAFDTVDHTILIDCLKHWVGISGSAQSFLTAQIEPALLKWGSSGTTADNKHLWGPSELISRPHHVLPLHVFYFILSFVNIICNVYFHFTWILVYDRKLFTVANNSIFTHSPVHISYTCILSHGAVKFKKVIFPHVALKAQSCQRNYDNLFFFSILFQPHTYALYFLMIAHEIWNGSLVCLLVGLSAGPHAAYKLWEVTVKVKERR